MRAVGAQLTQLFILPNKLVNKWYLGQSGEGILSRLGCQRPCVRVLWFHGITVPFSLLVSPRTHNLPTLPSHCHICNIWVLNFIRSFYGFVSSKSMDGDISFLIIGTLPTLSCIYNKSAYAVQYAVS